MVVAIGSATAGGILLHRAAGLESQAQRTQELGSLVFEVQDLVTRAGIGDAATVADRARALGAANAALRSVAAHDAGAGRRIGPSYNAYVRAFEQVALNGGRVPVAQIRTLERRLEQVEAKIDAEVARQARATRVTNPRARLALLVWLVSVGSLVALLLWQYGMERTAGRIDRDNAKRAEELMRLKNNFAASVSHELRTPLTSILGYLELLDDDTGTRPEEDEQYLAVVKRNAERLLRLVSDLLLVAEVEESVLALHVDEVDLRELARECVEAARPAADRKRISLELSSESPELLHGDRLRLAQMMDNLVSNAIKFTPEGGRVTVSTGSRGQQVLFEVADNGRGIAAADRDQLYEPFFRTRDAAVQAIPGTGLGLTITKAIVEAHDGSIEMWSTTGVGTTFLVLLPRAVPARIRSGA